MENSDASVPQPLIQLRERLNRFMYKFFQHHDRDSSGNIDLIECVNCLAIFNTMINKLQFVFFCHTFVCKLPLFLGTLY